MKEHLDIYEKAFKCGQQIARKTVGLCVFHGEFDLFMYGGEAKFKADHANCSHPQAGAGFESSKVMRKAA